MRRVTWVRCIPKHSPIDAATNVHVAYNTTRQVLPCCIPALFPGSLRTVCLIAHVLAGSLRTYWLPHCARTACLTAHVLPASLRTYCLPHCARTACLTAHVLPASLRTYCLPHCARATRSSCSSASSLGLSGGTNLMDAHTLANSCRSTPLRRCTSLPRRMPDAAMCCSSQAAKAGE